MSLRLYFKPLFTQSGRMRELRHRDYVFVEICSLSLKFPLLQKAFRRKFERSKAREKLEFPEKFKIFLQADPEPIKMSASMQLFGEAFYSKALRKCKKFLSIMKSGNF